MTNANKCSLRLIMAFIVVSCLYSLTWNLLLYCDRVFHTKWTSHRKYCKSLLVYLGNTDSPYDATYSHALTHMQTLFSLRGNCVKRNLLQDAPHWAPHSNMNGHTEPAHISNATEVLLSDFIVVVSEPNVCENIIYTTTYLSVFLKIFILKWWC